MTLDEFYEARRARASRKDKTQGNTHKSMEGVAETKHDGESSPEQQTLVARQCQTPVPSSVEAAVHGQDDEHPGAGGAAAAAAAAAVCQRSRRRWAKFASADAQE